LSSTTPLTDRTRKIAEIVASNAPLAVRGSLMGIHKGLTPPIYDPELLAENDQMKVARG